MRSHQPKAKEFDGTQRKGTCMKRLICAAWLILLLFKTAELHAGGGARIWLVRDTVVWDGTIQISNLSPFASIVPRIAAVNNHVYIMWEISGRKYNYLARSTDFGATWTPPVMLPDTSRYFYASLEYAVSGPVVYLTKSYRPPPYTTEHLWMRRSLDNAINWENGRFIHTGYPERVSAFAGEVSVIHTDSSPSIYPFFTYSWDRGLSWTQYPRVLTPQPTLTVGFALTKDPFAWRKIHYTREYGSAFRPEVSYTFSTNFGETWRPEVFVSPVDGILSDGPQLSADTSGTAILVWRDGRYVGPGGYGAAIYLRRTTDGGSMFLSEQLLSEQHRGVFQVVGVQKGNSTAVVLWKDMPSIGRGFILCRVSFDRGVTWSRIYNLTPNSVDVTSDPAVVVERDYIHACWWYQDSPTALSQIYYRRGRIVRDTTVVTVGLSESWNMVSVPVAVEDYSVAVVFPGAVGQPFLFDSSYRSVDTLEPGRGYWVKFAAETSVELRGRTIERDTIEVQAGWNLIGSISRPISVSAIRTIPPGIVASRYFVLSDNRYAESAVVEPGRAYWVKATEAGIMIRGP